MAKYNVKDEVIPIELEVLSPLSVGAGNENDWVVGLDCVVSNGYLYILDMNKISEYGKDIIMLTDFIRSNDNDRIVNLLGNDIEKCYIRKYKLPFKQNIQSINPIKTFLRTSLYGRPIVAGSSLKGAISSAITQSVLEINDTTKEQFRNNSAIQNGLGSLNPRDDNPKIMQFIQVADIELSETELLNTKIFNLQKNDEYWEAGWKHGNNNTSSVFRQEGFNTFYECATPQQKGLGRIVIKNKKELHPSFRNHSTTKEKLLDGGISELFRTINQATKKYLKSELDFFKNYDGDRCVEIITQINNLLSEIENDGNSCVLKMSAGAGFHSITGNWQYDDFINTGHNPNGKRKYKSRKIAQYADRLYLMGFVKLHRLESSDCEKWCEQLENQHTSDKQSILLSAEQRERVEKERAEEKLKKKKQAENEALYDTLIDEARQLLSDKNYDDAIRKVQEAQDLQCGKDVHADIIRQCEAQKLLIQQEEERLKNQEKQKNLRKDSLSKNLEGASNNISSIRSITDKWLRTDGNTFDDTALEAFISKAIEALESKKKDGIIPKKEIRNALSEIDKLKKLICSDKIEIIKQKLGL